MPLIPHPQGDYLFLPGISPYSCGVVSAPGFEIAHVTFRHPIAYRRMFDLIEQLPQRFETPQSCSLWDRTTIASSFHLQRLCRVQRWILKDS